jgi:urate oxidase
MALKTEFDCAEDYAVALGQDMLARHKHIHVVNIDISERIWERIRVDGKPHSHCFMSAKDPIKRSCSVRVTRTASPVVTSGLFDVKLMKTTQSGFAGYIEVCVYGVG